MCLSHFRGTAKSLSSSLPTWMEPAFLHAHTHAHTHHCRKKKSKRLPNLKICQQRGRREGRGLERHPSCKFVPSWLPSAGRALQTREQQAVRRAGDRAGDRAREGGPEARSCALRAATLRGGGCHPEILLVGPDRGEACHSPVCRAHSQNQKTFQKPHSFSLPKSPREMCHSCFWPEVPISL